MLRPVHRSRRTLSALVLAAAVPLAAVVPLAAPAGATTTGITANHGKIRVLAQVLVVVPVKVVCTGLGGAWMMDSVQVSLLEANGPSVSSGTGQTASGGLYQNNGPLLVCDGVTVNTVRVNVLPTAGSGPFSAGKGVITITVGHSESTGYESVTYGPRVVPLN